MHASAPAAPAPDQVRFVTDAAALPDAEVELVARVAGADGLDVAERPRSTGWSLRAALVRYAQPQPQRASDLIELVRRIRSRSSSGEPELTSQGFGKGCARLIWAR